MHTVPRGLRRRNRGPECVHSVRRRVVCDRAGRAHVLSVHSGQVLPRGHGRGHVSCRHILPRRESAGPDAVHARLALRGGRRRSHGCVRCGHLLPPRRVSGCDVPSRLLLHGRCRAAGTVPRGLLRDDGQFRAGGVHDDGGCHDVHDDGGHEPVRRWLLLCPFGGLNRDDHVPQRLLLSLWLGRAVQVPRGLVRHTDGALVRVRRRLDGLHRVRRGLLRWHRQPSRDRPPVPRGPVLRQRRRDRWRRVPGGRLLPRRLRRRHKLLRGHVFERDVCVLESDVCRVRRGHILSGGRDVVHPVRGGLFLRKGQRRGSALTMPRGLLLPGRRDGAHAVLGGLFLPSRLVDRSRLPRWRIWQHDGLDDKCVLGPVRDGLLLRRWLDKRDGSHLSRRRLWQLDGLDDKCVLGPVRDGPFLRRRLDKRDGSHLSRRRLRRHDGLDDKCVLGPVRDGPFLRRRLDKRDGGRVPRRRLWRHDRLDDQRLFGLVQCWLLVSGGLDERDGGRLPRGRLWQYDGLDDERLLGPMRRGLLLPGRLVERDGICLPRRFILP
jgi:hypothetical protein